MCGLQQNRSTLFFKEDIHTHIYIYIIKGPFFFVFFIFNFFIQKASLQQKDVDVLGPVNHGVFKSIYFFDPNGHRLEIAANTGTPEQFKTLKSVASDMVEEWSKTKVAPTHAAWLHQNNDE